MTRRTLQLLCAGAMVFGLSTGCATTSRLYVRSGPPPVIVEQRLASPGPGYVWQPGFHRWNGRDYVWIGGRYERAPQARASWVPGHWSHDSRGWFFVDGHWR